MHVLGIDIGGTGIKAAVVDVATGALVTPRQRVLTPQPASPEAISVAVTRLVHSFNWEGSVGCGLPAVIKDGIVRTASHITPDWIGVHGGQLLREALGRPVALLNDADAAGIAEMRFGAGRGRSGVVLMLTVGTGIGTALFVNGTLLPNTELGHIKIRGKDAERRASEAARKRKQLSFTAWAPLFDEYLNRVVALIWPDLIIVGGGASKAFDEFGPLLTAPVEVVPARLRNEAGVIGAALHAAASLPALPLE
ncbi:MAG: polyphosphate--glucose phosphotransferase [Chloroflexaceae bacterium]